MKQLSQQHPKPDAPLYTIFLSEKHDMDDAEYFHLVAKHPQDPDSTDVIYMFDKQKRLIGVQTENKPKVQDPLASQLIEIAGKPSTYNLGLPSSFPDFPQYESLVKALLLNNMDEPSK